MSKRDTKERFWEAEAELFKVVECFDDAKGETHRQFRQAYSNLRSSLTNHVRQELLCALEEASNA